MRQYEQEFEKLRGSLRRRDKIYSWGNPQTPNKKTDFTSAFLVISQNNFFYPNSKMQ